MAAIVRARSLTKTYGRSPALDSLDLDLGSGVTGLLGPNGAGKTTLLRILATALAPSGGELRVLGHDPGSASGRLEIRRRLGYVPQELGLYDNFTAFDFVDYVAILKEQGVSEIFGPGSSLRAIGEWLEAELDQRESA